MNVIESKIESLTATMERGVLVVRIELNSLMHELALKQIETELFKQLPRAKTAVIVDCEELRLHVSTQFLSTLVHLHKKAKKRGITLALCNLSNSMLASYEVTALSTLIPAFDSLQEAMWELGQVQPGQDASEARVKNVPSNAIDRSQHQGAGNFLEQPANLLPVAVVTVGLVTLCLAAAFWLSGAFPQTGANSRGASAEAPFDATLTGSVRFTDHGVTRNDADALVIAWPDGFSPRQKLAEATVERLSRKGSDWSHMVFVTRTANDGSFSMHVHGFGEKTGLNVLVISNKLRQQKPLSSNDQYALSQVFADPSQFVDNRRYHLDDVVIRKGVDGEHKVKF